MRATRSGHREAGVTKELEGYGGGGQGQWRGVTEEDWKSMEVSNETTENQEVKRDVRVSQEG